MQLDEFNALEATAAAAVVRPCAAIPTWVDAIVGARPFDDLAALLAYADHAAARWSGADVEQALADHPRIGERPEGSGTSAGMSRSEQGGVLLDGDVQTRLAQGNRRYEDTFDRIFLVRAAGRSAEEILGLLGQRLTNDPGTELDVTAGQLREIAALRLQGVFS